MGDVTLLEYWGQYDIDGDGYLEECLITVAKDSQVLLRLDYAPFTGGFKPFLRYTPIPVPGKFHGLSPLSVMAGLQDALNDRINQVGDNISLVLNRMWKKNKWADIDDNQLVSTPGGIVDVNQMTDLEPLEMQDIVPSVFPEKAEYRQQIQKAMGTFDYAKGNAPGRQEAATTVIALQNVAEIRFKTMALYFERMVVRPLGNMLIKLNKQYMNGPREIRILGDIALETGMEQAQFQTVAPDDLVINPDIYAVGAAMDVGVSKEMQLKNVMSFLTILAGSPQLMMNPLYYVDFVPILKVLPSLLNLKLGSPLVVERGNPLVAHQEVQREQQMEDQMIMGLMGAQGQMEADKQKEGEKVPSRTKGELKKSKVKTGGKKK
jgi:hypothetical protein